MPRVGIFRERKTTRYQGVVTEAGRSAFEEARTKLAGLVGERTASDGDVMQALAIGWKATAKYLKHLKLM